MREQNLDRCDELEVRSRIPNRVGPKERFPLLLYHSVSYIPRWAPFEYLVIPPEKFEAQIRGLARRGYNAIRVRDILRWQRDGTPLPAKSGANHHL